MDGSELCGEAKDFFGVMFWAVGLFAVFLLAILDFFGLETWSHLHFPVNDIPEYPPPPHPPPHRDCIIRPSVFGITAYTYIGTCIFIAEKIPIS